MDKIGLNVQTEVDLLRIDSSDSIQTIIEYSDEEGADQPLLISMPG